MKLLICVLLYLFPVAAFAGVFEQANAAYDTQDFTKAAALYQQAAGQNYALAQYRLGMLYINGQGVEQSDEQAADAFAKAADQGLGIAQYSLGVLYQKGRGVTKSKPRAAQLFRVAADQDVAQAQYSLAFLYFYGQGVLQSRELAVSWLKKSAALGNYDARLQLEKFGIQ
jgi:TPR repeat protein